MAWNSIAPLGTASVKTNKSLLADNTTYVETEMNKDHFWNIGGNEDGHHNVIQAPKQETGGTPTNPSLSSGMDGAIYLKKKLSSESPNNEDVHPFFTNEVTISGVPNIPQYLQLLGIRACATVNIDQTTKAITYGYKHNVTVSRSTAGTFRATFDSELPTNDYIVLGQCMKNSATQTDVALFTLPGTKTATLASQKSTTFFDFLTFTFSSTPTATDPITLFFVVFGG